MDALTNDFVEVYVHQEAKKGNQISGDMYYLHAADDYFICAIADGLGNGPIARLSAEVIPKMLERHHHETVDELLLRCNEQMSGKRGAAVAIVKMYYQEKKVEYSCVGNVRFYMMQQQGTMVYPLPVMGYLSGRKQNLKKQTFNYSEGSRFVLHSDGVALKSPKAAFMQTASTYELFENVRRSAKQDDDSTFIVGSLLQ
ncbi:PP2C family serine/threonine-protein phosphatase [Sporosarcina sp. HYO08]|uniref:PP2C family serine/threonine-protein phosphatase n=1 Tax=Sporosarcina sp. HYO08 TaxID=1759557 RepID=UPI0007964F95|nr:PP2C family serine/threonine-protein phosphatase [Sporosarcina sp. HYO08]KXH80959.1 phosphoserine phosphatase [Sporosarcina sp. HYO08]